MKEEGKNSLFVFLGLCLLSLGTYFLDKKGWLSYPKSVVQRPLFALERKFYSLKYEVDSWLGPLADSRKNEVKLAACELEVQKLAVTQNQLSGCLEENEKMRKLLGAPLPPSWKFLPAWVVGVTEEMRLDKGEKEGLKKGMNVVSENILVGKLNWVGEHESRVSLPVSPGIKISVLVEKRVSQTDQLVQVAIQARGLLGAEYGGNLILDKILQEEDVQKGDLVVTAGEEGWLPGLLIGEVKEVLPKSAEIYRRAQVTPLVSYQELRLVFVVIQ